MMKEHFCQFEFYTLQGVFENMFVKQLIATNEEHEHFYGGSSPLYLNLKVGKMEIGGYLTYIRGY